MGTLRRGRNPPSSPICCFPSPQSPSICRTLKLLQNLFLDNSSLFYFRSPPLSNWFFGTPLYNFWTFPPRLSGSSTQLFFFFFSLAPPREWSPSIFAPTANLRKTASHDPQKVPSPHCRILRGGISCFRSSLQLFYEVYLPTSAPTSPGLPNLVGDPPLFLCERDFRGPPLWE